MTLQEAPATERQLSMICHLMRINGLRERLPDYFAATVSGKQVNAPEVGATRKMREKLRLVSASDIINALRQPDISLGVKMLEEIGLFGS